MSDGVDRTSRTLHPICMPPEFFSPERVAESEPYRLRPGTGETGASLSTGGSEKPGTSRACSARREFAAQVIAAGSAIASCSLEVPNRSLRGSVVSASTPMTSATGSIKRVNELARLSRW